ncbi:hypothetical protein ACWDG1_09300 [Streptomyces sp. NPDC001177]
MKRTQSQPSQPTPSFEQRHFDASQGVYNAIMHGDISGDDVHAALVEAAAYASADEQPQER